MAEKNLSFVHQHSFRNLLSLKYFLLTTAAPTPRGLWANFCFQGRLARSGRWALPFSWVCLASDWHSLENEAEMGSWETEKGVEWQIRAWCKGFEGDIC